MSQCLLEFTVGPTEQDLLHLYPVSPCPDLSADRFDALDLAIDKFCAGHALHAVLVKVQLALRAWVQRAQFRQGTVSHGAQPNTDHSCRS